MPIIHLFTLLPFFFPFLQYGFSYWVSVPLLMLLTTLLFTFVYGSYTLGLKDLSVVLLVYSFFLFSPYAADAQGRDLLYYLREMLFSMVILAGFYWRPSQVFVKLNRDSFKRVSLYSFIVLGIIVLLLIWQSSKMPPFNDSFFIQQNKAWLVQNRDTMGGVFGPDTGAKRFQLAMGLRPSIFFGEPSYLTVVVSALYVLSSAYTSRKPRLSKIAFYLVFLSAVVSTSFALTLFALCCLLMKPKNFPNLYEKLVIIFTLTFTAVFIWPDVIDDFLIKLDPISTRAINAASNSDPSAVDRVGKSLTYFNEHLTSLGFGISHQQLDVDLNDSLHNGLLSCLLRYGIAFLAYMTFFIYNIYNLRKQHNSNHDVPWYFVLLVIFFITSSNGAFFAIDKCSVIFYILISLKCFNLALENSEAVRQKLESSANP